MRATRPAVSPLIQCSNLFDLSYLATSPIPFYEIECVRGVWAARELKRRVASLHYERSGLSRDKKKLAAMAHAKARHATP